MAGGGGRYGRNGPIRRRDGGIGGRRCHLGGVRRKIGGGSTPSCAATTGWRGRHIGRGGFRINADGQLFTPDSEDEDEGDIFYACVPDSEEEAFGDDGQLFAPDSEEEAAGDGGADAVFEAGAGGDADMEMEGAGVEGIEQAATGMELEGNGAAATEVEEANEQDVVVHGAGGLDVASRGGCSHQSGCGGHG
ncbi:unnamed protein product [Urochloa humidicola]